jgi:hypothetical protein
VDAILLPLTNRLKSGTLQCSIVLTFQEFLLHEEAGSAYNSGMAPKDHHSSDVIPAPDARLILDAIPGLHGLVALMALSNLSTGDGMNTQACLLKRRQAGAGRPQFMVKMSLDC